MDEAFRMLLGTGLRCGMVGKDVFPKVILKEGAVQLLPAVKEKIECSQSKDGGP
ncbi:MAG: hypothetical protein ABI396_12530 [Ktedonobacteraceae bacterium]